MIGVEVFFITNSGLGLKSIGIGFGITVYAIVVLGILACGCCPGTGDQRREKMEANQQMGPGGAGPGQEGGFTREEMERSMLIQQLRDAQLRAPGVRL